MADSWKVSGLAVSSAGKEVLRSIDVTFQPGRITLLVGRNGAGKSTFIETLAGLRAPSGGTILLGEEPLWRRKKLNRAVAMRAGVALQQSASQWFLSSAADEFRYSLKPYSLKGGVEEIDERAIEALASVGLPATFTSRDPRTLSGGQQRRLALAMLLACRAEWLLLDEPTAGLDYEGVKRLNETLAAHRAAGGGAVIVTHDLDALLPIADIVVVIDNGTVQAVQSAAAYAAALVEASPKGIPQALQAAALLREAGFELPGVAPWAKPNELAAVLTQALIARQVERPRVSDEYNKHMSSKRSVPSIDEGATATISIKKVDPEWDAAARNPQERKRNLFGEQSSSNARGTRFDPRAIIISYLLLSSGILLQQSWTGLLMATVIAFMLVWLPLRSAIAPWRGAIVLYFRIIVAIALFGGIVFSPLRFDWSEALITGFRMSKLLVVMVTGLPIAALTTPLRLQRAMEQTFGWLERFKIPVTQAALAVALIFRFLPMLQLEWERFVRIAHARGKTAAKPGKLPIRMLYVVMAPFMLSMLRGAEEISNALEARGYGRGDAKPTRALVLRWTRADSAATAMYAVVFAFLYAVRLMNV